MTDDPRPLTAADYLERSERARAQARARYVAYLAEMLHARGIPNSVDVADAVLAALTEWPDIETGEPCRCSCHPQLPSSELHDLGFDCNCNRTQDQRRDSMRKLLNDIDEYWRSTEGLRARASDETAEDELQAWLSQHQGVVVESHGGWAPEQWRGTVDGHRFYFRERGGDWDVEIDLRPTGESMRIIDGQNDEGTTRYRQQSIERGQIIASGTTYTGGYGATPVERAGFIVTTIRDHLRKQTYAHHPDKLDAISTVLGSSVDWCPTCGIRLAISADPSPF
ncbi:hypothetical protein KXD97_32455 (plasmid) [Mycobacterium sp. SMC-8]|uniref:hypothetical protein n=1 Tax=Mycobacterium sp. SMC-8 TaxID=2857060 RepID=UPI0021B3F81E|nr:hypothetical protein [Mycobacterium sp. SMC-8]UXA15855.1 hypothetical protein KXD97_32455 [Mycobacterium sp. SMC-8]